MLKAASTREMQDPFKLNGVSLFLTWYDSLDVFSREFSSESVIESYKMVGKRFLC